MVAMTTHTVVVAGVPVATTVTARPGVVRRWVYTTRWRLRRRQYSTVGLGVQWTPRFRAGADERPGTLQLCAGNRCLVFQIARAGGRVPMILRRFMADRRFTFAGRNVEADCRKLQVHHGLAVASPKLELRRVGGMGGNASMEAMAEAHLGLRGLTKSPKVGLSRWDGPRLSKKQVRYACVDAYLSCRLGVRLRSDEDGDRQPQAAVAQVETDDNYGGHGGIFWDDDDDYDRFPGVQDDDDDDRFPENSTLGSSLDTERSSDQDDASSEDCDY